jgi:hypothetical protein
MAKGKKTKHFYLGYIPRCPLYKPTPLLIILAITALGTWGIYYLNFWAAIGYMIYSLVFTFVLMPFTMCKHCYFKKFETSIDDETGETTKKLMSVDKWGKTLLHLHVGQKPWAWGMFLTWFAPVVMIIVSFFLNFNYLAVIALVAFIAAIAGNYLYMIKIKCPKCPIQKECHSAF